MPSPKTGQERADGAGVLEADATGERMAATTASNVRPYRSRLSDRADVTTWVQIDLGKECVIDSVRLYPSAELLLSADGFPLRFRIDCSRQPDFGGAELIADRTACDYADPLDRILEFSRPDVWGRYVRITAFRLRRRKKPDLPVALPSGAGEFHFSLGRIAVISQGRDVAVDCRVSVDTRLGTESDAAQLTRPPRPQGEGVVTDHPENVTAPREWKVPPTGAILRAGRVRLNDGRMLKAVKDNIEYLLDSFSPDDLLRPFRLRAGRPAPKAGRTPHPFWEEDLAGSSAGRFLMGAGNTLRCVDHGGLRARMNAVIEGIAECRQPDGYIMAYPPDSIFVSERGAYTRSWLTHGLIDAGHAGSALAFELLRGYYDWYNRLPQLPQLLRRCGQGGQGMVANTRLYFSPVGQPTDIQVVQRYFQENYWLEDLAHRRPEAIWQYPYDRPHCYLLTNLEAYLDLYLATGDERYLAAVDGGWELFHQHWEQLGGSVSLIEIERCEPGSNKIHSWLGETCGSAFWILLNHRLHALRPEQERYIAEIEKSIYNVLLANQDGSHGFRYHTVLAGFKEPSTRINTCCEGQGTRLVASLADFIYSVAPDGLYVNLFEPSTIEWTHLGERLRVTIQTDFPRSAAVTLSIDSRLPRSFRLRVRIPQWASREVEVAVNGSLATIGSPGTFVTIERMWGPGDEVSFRLPLELRMTKYTGSDQIAGRERFALEYGPLLMAAVGAAERQLIVFSGSGRAEDVIHRLRREEDGSCRFNLVGSIEYFDRPVRFMPYHEITDESFTCFPVIVSRTGIFP